MPEFSPPQIIDNERRPIWGERQKDLLVGERMKVTGQGRPFPTPAETVTLDRCHRRPQEAQLVLSFALFRRARMRVGLRGEATGTPVAHLGDVVAAAKRSLAAGEVLDGEGGYCVYGMLMPAAEALRVGALPIGLAHRVRLSRAIAAGEFVRWADVEVDGADLAVRLRREMEGVQKGYGLPGVR